METAFWNTAGACLQPLLRVLESTGALGKIPPRPVALPVEVEPQPPTSFQECDSILRKLHAHSRSWVEVGTAQRADLLGRCISKLLPLATEMAKAGARAKGSYESGYGEELASVLPIITGLAEYREAMLADGVLPPLSTRTSPSGQVIARVWPRKMIPTFFPDFVGEVWMEPGRGASQGRLYREKAEGRRAAAGKVALVLGAGNQLPVVALDLLHKLIAEDEVVVVKMNPVNDYLGPLLAQAFSPLVELGVLGFVYGGREVGEYLTRHQMVDSVHLTGSEATYNAIVWGAPDAPRVGPPRLSKPITAELGNVTPYIIVPGQWSEADIAYQAENVAAGLMQNCGHNCIAAELVVTDAGWPQRAQFLSALRRVMSEVQCRAVWYPGAEQRYEQFKAAFPQAEQLGRTLAEHKQQQQQKGRGRAVPWLLVTGLSPSEALTRHENWCGVLQEVALPGCAGDPEAFLTAAVNFANKQCWGTLACSVFIHPSTQQSLGRHWEQALADLQYGSINVNCPTTTGFAITPLTWGAWPGHPPDDICSGSGVVHNTYLFDHPQKSVLAAPWTYYPTPMWSMGQQNLQAALPHAFRFILNQNNPLVALGYLVLVAVHALRGAVRLGARKG